MYTYVYRKIYTLNGFSNRLKPNYFFDLFDITLHEISEEEFLNITSKNTKSGLTVKDGTHFNIYINKDEILARRLFTFYHELGHIVLGHFYGRSFVENKEKEANIFARNMLIPHLDFVKNPQKYELYKTVSNEALKVKRIFFKTDDYYCRKILEEENYICENY